MINDYEILAIHSGYAHRYFEAMAAVSKAMITRAGEREDDEERDSYLLQMHDDIAIVNISGALTSRDSWINQYFGLVSYNEIRKASINALENSASAVIYSWDSPGGTVNGMAETADFVSNMPVPTVSHAGGQMCSAAYCIGMQPDAVFASDFAETGSVGVLVKVYDCSRMNEMEGVLVKRFRSGPLKAVGDPDFKLSKEEEKYIESKVTTLSNKFYSAVAEARGIPVPTLEAIGVTSGRTYIGGEALQVGLIDSVQSFDQAMLKAYGEAKKYLDKQSQRRVF